MKILTDSFPEALGDSADGLKSCIIAFNRVMPFERVVMFGSYARGQNRPDSDVDLCVIIPGIVSQQEAARKLRKSIGRIRNKPALSLLPISSERLAQKQYINDPFYSTVFQEGVCLAEKD